MKKCIKMFSFGILSATILISSPLYVNAKESNQFNKISINEEYLMQNILPQAEINLNNVIGENGIQKYITTGDKYQLNSIGIDVQKDESITEEFAMALCMEAASYVPDIDASLIFSIMAEESHYKPLIENDYATGLCGIAKFHEGDENLKDYLGVKEINPYDPLTNVLLSAKILQDFYDIYKDYNPDMSHDELIKRVLGSYNGCGKDGYYVKKVLENQRIYKEIHNVEEKSFSKIEIFER